MTISVIPGQDHMCLFGMIGVPARREYFGRFKGDYEAKTQAPSLDIGVCFRFLYKTDGGSNGPILVPISRQHYLLDPVNQGNHVVYPPLFAKPHTSAGSPLALLGTPSASYHAA